MNDTSPAEADIRTKRIYRAVRNSDGKRILVDRLWPRGISKERARLHAWMKEIAPSDGLRKWFHAHDDRWDEFKQRYLAEIEKKDEEIASLLDMTRDEVVTLLYSSKNEERNNAVVLREYLLERLK